MNKELIYRLMALKLNGYEIPSFEVKVGDWYNLIVPLDFSNKLELEGIIRKEENFLIDRERYLMYLGVNSQTNINLTDYKLNGLREGINKGKKILIFDTMGLDPKGVDTMYLELNKFIDEIAIIELFYPSNTDTKVLPYVKVLDIEGNSFKHGIIQGSKHVSFKL